MTVDAENYATLDSWMGKFTDLVSQKFGPAKLFTLKDKDIADLAQIYHDMHHLLQKQNMRLVLKKILERATEPIEMIKELSDLNSQVESMRAVHQIATSKEEIEQKINLFASQAFLNDAQIAQLYELVQLYRKALQVVDDLEAVKIVEIDDESLCGLGEDEINAYLDDLYASKRWLQPVQMLFNFDKFEGEDFSSDLDAALSLFRLEFLRDEDEYQIAIKHFQNMKEPLLEDVAHLLFFFVHIMQNLSTAYEYIEGEIGTIQQVLERLYGYEADEWNIFEEFQILFNDWISDIDRKQAEYVSFAEYVSLEEFQMLFKGLIGSLYMMLGGLAFLSVNKRRDYLQKAESSFNQTNDLHLRTKGISLLWMRAQLCSDDKKDKCKELEEAAFNQLCALLTESVQIEEFVDRTLLMIELMILPAQWKMSKGKFQEAIEHIKIARSLAQAVEKVMGAEEKELKKYRNDPALSQEEREQIEKLHDYYKANDFAKFWTYICNLYITMCKIKLAESSGNFEKAEEICNDAVEGEKETRRIAEMWIKTFTKLASNSTSLFGPDASQYAIRAIYFQGMASLNRGDQSLMKRNYEEARTHYDTAKQKFEEAVEEWDKVQKQFTDSQRKEYGHVYHQEKKLSEDRMLYCDARNETAQAQKHSDERDFPQASKHYTRASNIFGTLKASHDRNRDRDILEASEKFYKGCADFEEARINKRKDTMQDAQALIVEAARLFNAADETLWAKYIQALSFEYQADIYKLLANIDPQQSTHYLQEAHTSTINAANIFQQLDGIDVRERVRVLLDSAKNIFAKGMDAPPDLSIAQVPKTTDNFLPPLNSIQSIEELKFAGMSVEQLNIEDKLKGSQNTLRSLKSDLVRCKTLYDKGSIDVGRYTARAKDDEVEILKNLQEVREVLEGRDENLDAIILGVMAKGQEAIIGEQDGLFARLVEVAQQWGLARSLIESLSRREDWLPFWLVEVGIQITRLAASK